METPMAESRVWVANYNYVACAQTIFLAPPHCFRASYDFRIEFMELVEVVCDAQRDGKILQRYDVRNNKQQGASSCEDGLHAAG